MVRSGAAGVLAEFSDSYTKAAVPALTEALAEALAEALDDEYVLVRTRAAKALGRIGPDAKFAVGVEAID